MLQRLPNSICTSKRCNEIFQIIYLYQATEIVKKTYNNIKNLRKLWNEMSTIFMNSKNSKKSEPHRLLLNLSDKVNLKTCNKYVALSNLGI